MIAVFTGNGKGKTTACLGHMVRALGYGKRAIMLQFIKGPWKSGEHFFIEKYEKKLGGNFQILRGGKGFVGILGDTLPFSEHKAHAQKTLKKTVRAVRSKDWDVVVLDEINVAIQLKLIPLSAVLKILKKIPKEKVVILSGRNAHPKIIATADLVTEMREIKHPFKKGILAQKGFDY